MGVWQMGGPSSPAMRRRNVNKPDNQVLVDQIIQWHGSAYTDFVEKAIDLVID